MFKNITVAFITRSVRTKPFMVGMAMAQKFNGNLTVIECVLKNTPKFVLFETKDDKKAAKKQKLTGEKTLKEFEAKAKTANISVKTVLALTESIPDWIHDYVKKHRTDLLIIDHPHLTDFEESYYDDIIKTVSHEVSVPLLLLRS